MVHISKRTLPKDVEEEIVEQFILHLAETQTRREMRSALFEFLTQSERVVLAKRLAILILLSEKRTYEEIENLLHVSPDTINRIAYRLEDNKYRSLGKVIGRIKESKQLAGVIERILQAGMPKIGRGRWRKTIGRT